MYKRLTHIWDYHFVQGFVVLTLYGVRWGGNVNIRSSAQRTQRWLLSFSYAWFLCLHFISGPGQKIPSLVETFSPHFIKVPKRVYIITFNTAHVSNGTSSHTFESRNLLHTIV